MTERERLEEYPYQKYPLSRISR